MLSSGKEGLPLLVDEVFPDVPQRQWVNNFPFPLRYLFAAHTQVMGKVLGIVYRATSTHLTHKAGLNRKEGATEAVTLIQHLGRLKAHAGICIGNKNSLSCLAGNVRSSEILLNWTGARFTR